MENKIEEKSLFDTIKVGELILSNRIAMASLTRSKCNPNDNIPNDLLVKHYSDRASAGLILTECSPISFGAQSFFGAGGTWNSDQANGWKKVVDAVHEKNGKIFMQIWHAGRAVNPKRTGENNLSSSSLPIKGFRNDGSEYELATPKEMTTEDIEYVKDLFKKGAQNAKEAGFDGIELHGANGYLIDQFIRDGCNQRDDDYGGSVEKRCRFCLEVMDILIEVFGAGRVGIKLSPVGRFQHMYDSNPKETYGYLLQQLDAKKIAYVQLMEPTEAFAGNKFHYKPGASQIQNVCKEFRSNFKGILMTNNNYTPETALKVIQEGHADMISFGRLFITNPDLVDRIKNNWPINFKRKDEGDGDIGYNDYPTYLEEKEKLEKEKNISN